MRSANSPVAHVYPLIGLVLCLTLALLSSDVLGINSCPPPANLDPTGALGYKNYIHGGCISKTKNTGKRDLNASKDQPGVSICQVE
jgi:hypothetical protein